MLGTASLCVAKAVRINPETCQVNDRGGAEVSADDDIDWIP